MSEWARANPERMAEISRLPVGEQNDALRAEVPDLWRDRLALRRRKLASALHSGEVDAVRIAQGGGGFALDLTDRQCNLCGGNFPPIGYARMWLDSQDGEPRFCHTGCLSEAMNWAEE